MQTLKELVNTQALIKIRVLGEAKCVVKRYFADNKNELEIEAQEVLIKKRKQDKKCFYEHITIVAPQLLQSEILFRMHELNHHQGMNKTVDKIDLRFNWPGMHQSVARWINACLACQHARTTSEPQGFPKHHKLTLQ